MLYFEKKFPQNRSYKIDRTYKTRDRTMSETQNTTRKKAEQSENSSDAPQSKLKKLWGYFNAFLDYVDEEAPESLPESDAPKSKTKKAWAAFNAFLDSLEVADPEPQDQVPDRGNLLKKTGNICWEVILHGAIVVFLFALAIFGTIKAMNFVNERRVPLYPSDEVVSYLESEHESLEAIVDGLPAGKDRSDSISPDLFGEHCAAILKPLRIYSDEYGVYLMTSKNGYVGENGIFIARDKENMPGDLSWGLIKGRVFSYAFFK